MNFLSLTKLASGIRNRIRGDFTAPKKHPYQSSQTYKPAVEMLESRINPSFYYWNPVNPMLSIAVSTAGNWTNVQGQRA
jgi:hypothetical protein